MQTKRYMHRASAMIQNISNVNQNIMRLYSTRTAINLSKKVANDLANDGTGKHAHILENKCILKGCEHKKCINLCDDYSKSKVLGHNTHKPPIGRFARFIDDHDANGDPQKQYFVKTNKTIEITKQEKQKYCKEIKENNKQTSFVKNHDEKYDDNL